MIETKYTLNDHLLIELLKESFNKEISLPKIKPYEFENLSLMQYVGDNYAINSNKCYITLYNPV